MIEAKRIEYIDIIKGIGIILVVWGHALGYLHNYIYSFHMPLFVFISGIFFSTKDFRIFLGKKIKRLIVPFLFYSILSWLIYLAIIYFKYPDHTIIQIKKVVYILAGSGQNGIIQPLSLCNFTMWFLPYLFVTEILFWFLFTYVKKECLKIGLIITCSILGTLLSIYDLSLPYSFDTVLFLAPFFYLGTKFLTIKDKLDLRYIIGITLVILHISLYQLNVYITGVRLDISSGKIGNPILYYLAAFSAILYIFIFCMKIRNFDNWCYSILNYFGVNSITILITHVPLLQFCNHMLGLIPMLSNQVIFCRFISFLIVFLISPILIKLINRYIPWSIGIR